MGTEDQKGNGGENEEDPNIFGTINKHEAVARILAGGTASTRLPNGTAVPDIPE